MGGGWGGLWGGGVVGMGGKLKAGYPSIRTQTVVLCL